jgi:hypothetical protein
MSARRTSRTRWRRRLGRSHILPNGSIFVHAMPSLRKPRRPLPGIARVIIDEKGPDQGAWRCSGSSTSLLESKRTSIRAPAPGASRFRLPLSRFPPVSGWPSAARNHHRTLSCCHSGSRTRIERCHIMLAAESPVSDNPDRKKENSPRNAFLVPIGGRHRSSGGAPPTVYKPAGLTTPLPRSIHTTRDNRRGKTKPPPAPTSGTALSYRAVK